MYFNNPDMPTNNTFEYLRPPITQQPDYSMQGGVYWDGRQQAQNPFNNSAPDARMNLAQQPSFVNPQTNNGMPNYGGMNIQQPGVIPFTPNMQAQTPNFMNGYAQQPTKPEPVYFGNGVGTFGVEGNVNRPVQQMGFNQMVESRRNMIPSTQPSFANQQMINNMTGNNMYQQSYQQPPVIPMVQPIQQGIPNWGPGNQYTQPQTPIPPVVNFQNDYNTQRVEMKQPYAQFHGVTPSWMDILRSNWDY